MFLFTLALFATKSATPTPTGVPRPSKTDAEAPPPPTDLYSSKKWCPEKAKLCVSAAASGTLGLVDIQLEFTLLPQNYVSIGFGGKKMEKSDMLVLTNKKLKSGKTKIVVEDYYSESYTLPKKDKKQDYQVLVADEKSGGRHVVIVRRKIDTGDPEDNVFNWNGSFDMIWARGEVVKSTLKKHTEAGSLDFVMAKFDKNSKPTGSKDGDVEAKPEETKKAGSSALPMFVGIILISLIN